MTSASAAVVVMAKAPFAGEVKTRLSPLLGPDGCAVLQAALFRRAVATASAGAPHATYVAVHPPGATGAVGAQAPQGVRVLAQEGANLGERMRNAAAHLSARGHAPVVVIGTDVPQLRTEHIEQAITQLADGCDVVFGPALDGGYYLVGLSRQQWAVFGIDPGLWGGLHVLGASLSAAAAAGLAVGLLEPLRDLDTPEDAVALCSDPELPTEIRRLLSAPAGTTAR